MNHYLETIIKEKKFTGTDGKIIELNWNVPIEEGLKLQELMRENNVATTLEIGTAFGISSIFICEAIIGKPSARHITMDPFQDSFFKNNGVNNIKQAGYFHLVEFYNDFSHFVLPDLVRKKIKVDFAFIDGYHTFDYAFVDFYYADLLLNTGGILVLDDTQWPAVRKVAEYIASNRAYELVYPPARNIGKHTWRHSALIGLMQSVGKYDLIDERIRKFDEFKPAHELPLSPRFIAFRKTQEDKDHRKEETFHRVF